MPPNKDNIFWYSGHRRLTPTPYQYIKPGLHFLKGQEAPKEVYEKRVIKVEEVKHIRKATELF